LILSIDSEIEDSSEEKAPEEKKQTTQKKEFSPHLKVTKVMRNTMWLF
jgi:hypothetical protein